MASKYDTIWRGELDTIRDLLQQAYETGRSSELDISELRNHGNRQSWYGVVDFANGRQIRGEMAHVRSLGRVLLESGALQEYPNTRFRAIVSSTLKLRIERGETTTSTRVLAMRKARRDIAGATEAREETTLGRVDELVSVLKEIPLGAWERIVEWPEMAPVYRHLGFTRFSVFLVATGLNDYQLKGTAETAYWPPLCQLLLRSEPPSSPERLLTLLDPYYAQERLGTQKRRRLVRFLRSSLARQLWIGTPAEAARDFARIWRRMASLMRQPRSAKTIAFAMKCLGWSLLMSGERSFDFASIPIPVDSRVRRFMERVGISFGTSEGAIQRGWERVLDSLREVPPTITMLHLDTLIWEIGTRPPEEILTYFEDLGLPELGQKVVQLLEEDVQGSALPRSFGSNSLEGTRQVRLPTGPNSRRILVIFPCSGSKSEYVGRHTYSVEEGHRVMDFLGDTGKFLLAGKEGNRAYINTESALIPAIDRYSGFLYRTEGLREAISTAERKRGVHGLIMSGGYGIVRPSERIHSYNRRMNVAYWTRHRLPDVIFEYIERSRITEAYAFVSRTTDYAKLLQRVDWPGLAALGSLEVAREFYVNFVGGGSAQRIVPQLTGRLLVSFVDSGFSRSGFPPDILDGQPVQTLDLLES